MCTEDFELKIDDQTYAYGKVRVGADVIGDEFCHNIQPTYEVLDFSIVTWIDGSDEIAVTSCFTAKRLEHYKEKFLAAFLEVYQGAA